MYRLLSWFKNLSSLRKAGVIVAVILCIVFLPLLMRISSVIFFLSALVLFFLVLTQPIVRDKLVEKLRKFRIPGIASNRSTLALAAIVLTYLLVASIAFGALGIRINRLYNFRAKTSKGTESKASKFGVKERDIEEEFADQKAAYTGIGKESAGEEDKRPGEESIQVVGVIDGDTVVVLLKGKEEKVRFIGIDSPESGKTYFKEAEEKTKELVLNKYVRLESDVSDKDQNGRLLRYVYIGSIFVNAELVKQGYARTFTSSPDTKYEGLFKELEEEAKENRRGIWTTAEETAVEPEKSNLPD